MRIRSVLLVLAAVASVAPASAAGPRNPADFAIAPPSAIDFPDHRRDAADLTVNITGPAGVYVANPGTYQVLVANTGTKSAAGVMLTIALPRTHTSPVVHVLGTLGARDGRCTPSGTNLSCPLGSMPKNTSTVVTFTIALPQSSAPLVVGATVVTSSAELSTTNNNDSDTAHLLHPLTTVSAGQTAHVEHCTGTGLTSFFECVLYPSSISSHDFQVLSGGTLAFIGAPASYWGTWSQSAGGDRLLLEYYDGTSNEATFDGYAVGNDCFEGVTVFHPTSPYVAPYRVCLH